MANKNKETAFGTLANGVVTFSTRSGQIEMEIDDLIGWMGRNGYEVRPSNKKGLHCTNCGACSTCRNCER
jgi:hypothetical protein